MFGLGGTELLIILFVTVLVFGGPAVIGFWFGYQAGKKAKDEDVSTSESAAAEVERADVEERNTNG